MKHDVKVMLDSSGLKATSARIAIIELFSNDCKPANADYIFQKLKTKNINLVTIYRTLTTFETARILKRVDLHQDSVFYELANHHHHHIVCTDCGILESFELCTIKTLSKNILNNSLKFESIQQHSLEFFGTCKSCAKI